MHTFVPMLRNGSPPTLCTLGIQEQSTRQDSLSTSSALTTRKALDLHDLMEFENRPTGQVPSLPREETDAQGDGTSRVSGGAGTWPGCSQPPAPRASETPLPPASWTHRRSAPMPEARPCPRHLGNGPDLYPRDPCPQALELICY